MKKSMILLLGVMLLLPYIVNASSGMLNEYEDVETISETDTLASSELIPSAKSGLLMEASTGKIVFEKEKDLRVSVASMTKMMLQIIVLEHIESGKIKWEDMVTTSPEASSLGGSQLFLSPGEEMTVLELFKGVSMASANDASVALAEHISGSEKEFVKIMNEKVKQLNLKNTKFKNSTGLDEEDHYSSAYDMAIIAQELLKHEKILEFSSLYEDYLRVDTKENFWLVNTNKLVRFYEGADGLKTGFTDDAMYCLAATAKRGDLRFIAIVLGVETGKIRNAETMKLLDYGFAHYQMEVLKKQDEIIERINLEKSDKKQLEVRAVQDVSVLVNKAEEKRRFTYDIKLDELTLPIKKGDTVGKIEIKEDNKIIHTVSLISNTNAKPIGFGQLYLKILKETFMGEFK